VTDAASDAGEVAELLSQLIRNACVNDGSEASGNETRNVDTLRAYLGHTGLDLEVVGKAALPDRASLIVRIEGSDPNAPSLSLLGHTDVVPVNRDGWSRDPFEAEIVDGELWGRGAVDMLNQTAAMAVAFRRLAASGFRPRGTLVYSAIADEEAGGVHGAEYLTRHHPDDVVTDYVLTEVGGVVSDGPGGSTHVSVSTAEKGGAVCHVTLQGTPSHGSTPYGSDNALIKAAEAVRRIAAYRPATRISDTWRGWVDAQGFPDAQRDVLLDEARLWDALPTMPSGLARNAHACTHTTYSPDVIRGGQKINIVPDKVVIEVDVRFVPGESVHDARAALDTLLEGLDATVEFPRHGLASASPTDTPLWAAMERAAHRMYPDAVLVPSLLAGATDARYFRPLGTTTYGFGLLSRKLSPARYWSMFHGNDERIDLESLALSVQLWHDLATDFLG
jgi:acetylornithine deacetylase/succinyl-diaminopimelate desuccinylase-like protein